MQPLSISKERVYSIDVLRGIVMILMALDHTRDFFHVKAMTEDALRLDADLPFTYITRWITHFCAPIFVFLSGLSVHLMHGRKTAKEISGYLLKRGLWLILVEVTLVTFGLTFNPLFSVLILQVIWTIGICFVCLSIFVFLPWQAVLAIGVLITIGHNALDAIEAQPDFKAGLLWQLTHKTQYTLFQFAPGHGILVIYPFFPWLGIMMMGYGLGRAYLPDIAAARRKRLLITAGISMILLFVIVRWLNVYGDPRPWVAHPGFWATVGDFMNVNKYPPSMMYACATLGPALLMLAALEGKRGKALAVAKVYGSVPFFYYILHFYFIHILCVILFFATGHGTNEIVDMSVPFLFRPRTFGFPLIVVYVIWIGIVALLYPLCKRYAAYKQANKKWWLSYI